VSEHSRRDFLRGTVAAGVVAGTAGWPSTGQAARRSATDWVTLGDSGIKVTRLAFGTSTYAGRVQRELRLDHRRPAHDRSPRAPRARSSPW
jgi:hypothetical protein